MRKARKWLYVLGATALMIKAQSIGAREVRRHSIVDEKRQRNTKAGNLQAILARRLEGTEISLPNLLIWLYVIGVTFVFARRKLALKNRLAAACFSNLKRLRWNFQFTQTAEI